MMRKVKKVPPFVSLGYNLMPNLGMGRWRGTVTGPARFWRHAGTSLFLAVAILAPAHGQTAPGANRQVTLSEAAELAATMDITSQLTDLEKAVAAEGVEQAKGARRPRVSLSLEYTQTQQNIISQDNATFQKGQSTYPVATVKLTVRQPIYDAERFRQLPLAQAEEVLAKAKAESALIDRNRSLVAAFVAVAQAQVRVRQAQQVFQVRTQFARDVALMVDSGRADMDQQMRAEGDVFSAATSLADAQADQAEAMFELQRFTGIDVGGVRGDAATIADPRSLASTFSLENLETMNPAIQIAKAELAVAERQLEAVQARFRPTANLKLEGSYNQSRGSLFGGGSTVSSVDLGLEVNWSIYEGGVRASQVRAAQAQVEMAKLRVDQARELAKARFVALNAALTKARSVIATTSQEQQVSAERATAAQESLDAGSGSMETVLEAGLRRDLAALSAASSRMRTAQIQAELFALFGALDIGALSRDFAGG